MSKHGEFRTIEAGLLHRPVYQELSAEAQHLYMVLLVILGPLRIALVYDEEIRGCWGDRSQAALEQAREELCSGDSSCREGVKRRHSQADSLARGEDGGSATQFASDGDVLGDRSFRLS